MELQIPYIGLASIGGNRNAFLVGRFFPLYKEHRHKKDLNFFLFPTRIYKEKVKKRFPYHEVEHPHKKDLKLLFPTRVYKKKVEIKALSLL